MSAFRATHTGPMGDDVQVATFRGPERNVPYQGYEDPDRETWPQHRCLTRDLEARSFTRFTLSVPPIKPW